MSPMSPMSPKVVSPMSPMSPEHVSAPYLFKKDKRHWRHWRHVIPSSKEFKPTLNFLNAIFQDLRVLTFFKVYSFGPLWQPCDNEMTHWSWISFTVPLAICQATLDCLKRCFDMVSGSFCTESRICRISQKRQIRLLTL